MENFDPPQEIGKCDRILPDGTECHGTIFQEIVEAKRSRIGRLFLGKTRLAWRCSNQKCNEFNGEYPMTNPEDIIRSLTR